MRLKLFSQFVVLLALACNPDTQLIKQAASIKLEESRVHDEMNLAESDSEAEFLGSLVSAAMPMVSNLFGGGGGRKERSMMRR